MELEYFYQQQVFSFIHDLIIDLADLKSHTNHGDKLNTAAHTIDDSGIENYMELKTYGPLRADY